MITLPSRGRVHRPTRFVLDLLVLSCGVAALAGEPAAVEAEALLPHGREPRPGLWTGGEPSHAQLEALAAAGVRTIVSLRTDGEPTAIGRREVEALGLRWVQIPIAGRETLDREHAAALHRIVADPEASPLVVYCATGNRVGALLALGATWHEGLPAEEALRFGQDAGLTRLEPAVREILGLPPATP